MYHLSLACHEMPSQIDLPLLAGRNAQNAHFNKASQVIVGGPTPTPRCSSPSSSSNHSLASTRQICALACTTTGARSIAGVTARRADLLFNLNTDPRRVPSSFYALCRVFFFTSHGSQRFADDQMTTPLPTCCAPNPGLHYTRTMSGKKATPPLQAFLRWQMTSWPGIARCDPPLAMCNDETTPFFLITVSPRRERGDKMRRQQSDSMVSFFYQSRHAR